MYKIFNSVNIFSYLELVCIHQYIYLLKINKITIYIKYLIFCVCIFWKYYNIIDKNI